MLKCRAVLLECCVPWHSVSWNLWKLTEDRQYWWWKGTAAEARELISHLESIRSIFGNPQQFATLVQGAWSQNTYFQKCRSAGTFILLQHARLGAHSHVSTGLVRADLVSSLAQNDCRGGNMFYHANTAGMGVENLFFVFVNKLVFLRGPKIFCPATGLHSTVHYCLKSVTDLDIFTQTQIWPVRESFPSLLFL